MLVNYSSLGTQKRIDCEEFIGREIFLQTIPFVFKDFVSVEFSNVSEYFFDCIVTCKNVKYYCEIKKQNKYHNQHSAQILKTSKVNGLLLKSDLPNNIQCLAFFYFLDDVFSVFNLSKIDLSSLQTVVFNMAQRQMATDKVYFDTACYKLPNKISKQLKYDTNKFYQNAIDKLKNDWGIIYEFTN